MTVGTNALLDRARRPHGAGRDPRVHRPARHRAPGPPPPLPPLRAEGGAAGRRGAAIRAPPSGSAPTGVVEPLGEDELERLVAEELRDSDAESVAICLLFSYLEPAHERAIAERLRAELPERPRLGLARGAGPVSRVRALLDDRDRRLPLPAARPLPRPARRGGRRARAARAGGDDVLGRRRARPPRRRGPAPGACSPGRPAARSAPGCSRGCPATATRSASTWAAPRATSAWSRTGACGAPTRARSAAG